MSCSVGASGVDSVPTMAEKALIVCSLINVPAKHHSAFAYLDGTQLFFLDSVRRMNRLGFRDNCICFVTDYTINIATRRGQVTRCAKMEDVAELICDDKRHTLGVHMRSCPFAVAQAEALRRNCFYEMPVDLVLYADSAAQYASLLHVLRFVYRTCTHETLPCRPLKQHESWQAALITAPDGSRVKKRCMCYHPVVGSMADDLANVYGGGTTASNSPPILSAVESSPVVRSPSPAASPKPSVGTPLPQCSTPTAPVPDPAPDCDNDLPVLVALDNDAPVVSSSATRRRVNPLIDMNYDPDTPVDPAKGSPLKFAATTPVCPSPSKSSEITGASLRGSQNGTLTSSTTPPAATSVPLLAAAAAAAVPPAQPAGSVRLLIQEPPLTRYSQEGELDEVGRSCTSFIGDPNRSRYTSAQWSSRSFTQRVFSPPKTPNETVPSTPHRLSARPKSASVRAGAGAGKVAR